MGKAMTQRVLSMEQKKQYESMRNLLQACLTLTEKCSDAESYKIVRDRLTQGKAVS
jgi:RNA polymerase-interacting CarD/CdnL/TRCF family regulator